MSIKGPTTPQATAVAIIAVCKALSAISPRLVRHLAQARVSAEQAGLPASDLALLRVLATSASATAAYRAP